MQFTIIAVLLSFLALLNEYLDKLLMNETNYNSLIILSHEVKKRWCRYILSEIGLMFNYLFAIIAVMLGIDLKQEDNVTYFLMTITVSFALAFLLWLFYKIAAIKIMDKVHHSVDMKDTDMQSCFISYLAPSINFGLVIKYRNLSEEINNYDIWGYVFILICVIMPCINLCIKYYKKEKLQFAIQCQRIDKVGLDTSIKIQIGGITYRKIDIVVENVAIDSNGWVWVYARDDVKRDILYHKLDKETTLVIGQDIIDETNYKDYIKD